jgi:hypothetical protein
MRNLPQQAGYLIGILRLILVNHPGPTVNVGQPHAGAGQALLSHVSERRGGPASIYLSAKE